MSHIPVPYRSNIEQRHMKGVALGYAGLDSNAKVPVLNLGGSGGDSTKFLRGDGIWAVPEVSGSGEPHIPVTFLIYNDGGVYKARDGNSGAISYQGTELGAVVNSCIAALPYSGGLIFIRAGLYNQTVTIVVNKHGVTLCGEGMPFSSGVGESQPAGTMIYCKTGDSIQLKPPTGETYLYNPSILDMGFRSDSTAGHGITSHVMTTTQAIHNTRILNCHFRDFYTAGKSAINLKNLEYVWVVGCYFAYCGTTTSAGLNIYEESYNGGHWYMNHNHFTCNETMNYLAYVRIAPSSSGGHEVQLAWNHTYVQVGSTTPCVGYLLDATSGYLINVDLYRNDLERNTIKVVGGGAGYTSLLNIEGNRFLLPQNNSIAIDINDLNSMGIRVRDNYILGQGSGITGIKNRVTSSYPTIIEDNILMSLATPLDLSNSNCIVAKNKGYNPVGHISNPVSGSYLIDSGSSTIASGVTYTNRGSRKTIFIRGGDVYSVEVDGTVVFYSSNIVVPLEAGQTFEITWTTAPTIVVIGD